MTPYTGGVEGLSLCSVDECWNLYPLRESLDGADRCPPCRGDDRAPARIETDPADDEYRAEVYKHCPGCDE